MMRPSEKDAKKGKGVPLYIHTLIFILCKIQHTHWAFKDEGPWCLWPPIRTFKR
jgi:hypothetical protein